MKFIIKFFCLAIVLTSCEIRKDKKYVDSPNILFVELNNGEKQIVRKDDYGTYSFSNWNSYNIININVHRAEDIDYKTSRDKIHYLNEHMSNLQETIPNWLKTEDILEDVKDVQEKYKILLKESGESTAKVRENWQMLTENFNDLREDLSDIVEDYNTL